MIMKVSIITATYNRGYCLDRLYKSLLLQNFKNFEWVVVDDGSEDNTADIIENFIGEKPFFEIKYLKVKNGGKHRAINRGMYLLSGELTLILDSDDWLSNDALDKIIYYESTIKNKKEYAGVYGLKVYPNKEVVGSTFCGSFLDCTYLERNKHNIHGDKCEVYYTAILKKFPFPEFPNEKFCTECLVWDLIAANGYKIRFFNEKIHFCDYLDDGLTKQGNLLYARNPKQYGLFVYHSYHFKKQSKFYASIKIYEYYLYEKKQLTFDAICENLHLNKFFVRFWISFQFILDWFRKFLRRPTIKNNVLKDLGSR